MHQRFHGLFLAASITPIWRECLGHWSNTDVMCVFLQFVYVNQSFAPSLDVSVGVLYEVSIGEEVSTTFY